MSGSRVRETLNPNSNHKVLHPIWLFPLSKRIEHVRLNPTVCQRLFIGAARWHDSLAEYSESTQFIKTRIKMHAVVTTVPIGIFSFAYGFSGKYLLFRFIDWEPRHMYIFSTAEGYILENKIVIKYCLVCTEKLQNFDTKITNMTINSFFFIF